MSKKSSSVKTPKPTVPDPEKVIAFNEKIVDVMQKYADMFGDETNLGGHRELFDTKYKKTSPEPSKKYYDFVHEGDNFKNFIDEKAEYFIELGEKKRKSGASKNETEIITEFLTLHQNHKDDAKLIKEIWQDLKVLFMLSVYCYGKKRRQK